MLFNSFGYLIFLPVVVALFWLSPQRLRTPLLLIASYVFYMTWKPVYGLLIFALTAANFFLGLAIHKSERAKLPLLLAAVAANLLVLGFFKYTYFTRDLFNEALAPLGKAIPAPPFEIILPLGISFFVFEFIHYVTDVYRGSLPVRSFPAFALFASFFPTQIAGPIKRFQDFIPQLDKKLRLTAGMFEEGVSLILFGLFKKVLFADNLAVVVGSAFDHPELLSTTDMWLATYAFAFQIYFDFSGYTDIARGSALLIGYKVPPNFNLPYLAGSITDFWHRWHISLSTWLRDYLFIPLGGSKCSRILNYRNLLITMVLGGLWHGASMHFLAWGAYQGIFLIAHKEYRRLTAEAGWLGKLRESALFHAGAILVTFHVVCVGWVFFRAETVERALEICRKLLFMSPAPDGMAAWQLSIANTADPIIFMLLPFVIALLFSGQLLCLWLDRPAAVRPRLPLALRAAYVACLICALTVLSPDTSPKFIYFQF